MLRDMQRDMQSMMLGMQQDMWQMQRDMSQAQQQMHSEMAQASQQMHSGMFQAQQQQQMHSAAMRQQMQSHVEQHRARYRDSMRASREQHREARLQRREARDQDRESRRSQRQAFGGGPPGMFMVRGRPHEGVSTSVVNGDVYINGEFVTRVPNGGPVALDSNNGVVRLNGNVVWPRAGEASLPPEGAPEVHQPLGDTFYPPSRHHQAQPNVEETTVGQAVERAAEEATRIAYRSSCEGTCPRDHPEPCSVCLDDIEVGQQIRTLPCFHFLHAQCAAAHFARPSVLTRGARPEVVCPVCRVAVGPESTEL